VLPAGEHGQGAAALVRSQQHDMFGLGSREAVMHALVREDPRGFGAPAPAEDLAVALSRAVRGAAVAVAPDRLQVEATLDEADERSAGAAEERAEAVAFAHGWSRAGDSGRDGVLGFVPSTP
jgi:coenzyme F420-0:L-glutamate ligase/coenzyme F420-1:gamma-L-glutamate ligase